MSVAIVIDKLTKRFGTQLALDHLDLDIKQSEIFGFLGPNGSGKTTTIRLLLDLIRPTSGHATILGVDCQRDSRAARRLVGYLPGELHLYPSLRGREMVDLTCSLRGKSPDWIYLGRLVERLDLDLSHPVATYSKGTRQKLGVVLALLDRPPVLLLDEPTSGLDPIMQHVVWEILREEVARGTTVFFSSHILSEVEHVCDRVAMLRAGRLIAVEPVAQLKSRAIRHVEVTFAGGMPGDHLASPEARVVDRTHQTLTLEVAGDVDRLIKALSHYHVADLLTEQPSLDDILLSYYGQGVAA